MTNQGMLKIKDVVSTSIHTIEATATVHDAIGAMRDAKVSSLVVNRRDEDDEYGLLVVSDIAREVIAQNRSPERVNVYEIMSKPVLNISADMQAKYAIRLLVKFGLSRAMVIDDSRTPVGIVTLRDLVLRHGPDEA